MLYVAVRQKCAGVTVGQSDRKCIKRKEKKIEDNNRLKKNRLKFNKLQYKRPTLKLSE